MATKANPQTPGTKYRDVDGSIKVYGPPKPAAAPKQEDSGSGALPDNFFAQGPQQAVQNLASQLPDYDKYLRQFQMEDYDTAKKRLEENNSRWIELSKQGEQIGMESRRKNYEGALRRSSVGYIRRGISTGKSGIVQSGVRDMREGYEKDRDLFAQSLAEQRKDQETQVGRAREDIEKNQRRNTVSDVSRLTNALYTGVTGFEV